MMPSFMRGWLAVIVTYCLIVGPAFAGDYKPARVPTFCISPEVQDKMVEELKNGNTEAASAVAAEANLAGVCINTTHGVFFLGEKIVREYGDLSEVEQGTGNVLIEGILLGWEPDRKVYVWVDDDIHPRLLLVPEEKL